LKEKKKIKSMQARGYGALQLAGKEKIKIKQAGLQEN
jgi:hypothetical protein